MAPHNCDSVIHALSQLIPMWRKELLENMLLSMNFISLARDKKELPEIFVWRAVSAGLIYVSATGKSFQHIPTRKMVIGTISCPMSASLEETNYFSFLGSMQLCPG